MFVDQLFKLPAALGVTHQGKKHYFYLQVWYIKDTVDEKALEIGYFKHEDEHWDNPYTNENCCNSLKVITGIDTDQKFLDAVDAIRKFLIDFNLVQ